MAVTAGTDKRYRERFADVVSFAKMKRLSLNDLDEWDVALDAYGLHLFEHGEAAAALRMAVDMTTDAHIRLSRAEAVRVSRK